MTPIQFDSGAILVYVGAEFIDFSRFLCTFHPWGISTVKYGSPDPLSILNPVDVEVAR